MGQVQVQTARTRQFQLAGETAELEQAVGALEAKLRDRQAALESRVANLETIITSQTRDTLHDDSLSNADEKLLSDADGELRTLREELGDARKAETLAKRLK